MAAECDLRAAPIAVTRRAAQRRPSPPMTLIAVLRHLAFAATLALLSAATVRLMIAVRVLDHPNARSAHREPTPKGGGVGIVLAFLVGVVVLYRYADFARLADPYFLAVIGAAFAIAVVGLLDDLLNWPFTVKLTAQVLAALVAVGSGLYLRDYRLPYVGGFYVGWLGPPITICWIVFATNAMNFIDGLNGLAAGVTLVTCAFLAVIAEAHAGWFAYFAALLLAAGVAGFLPFNFPRARIFMSDVGSQFCGFVLAVLAVVASRFQGDELSFLVVPMLLSGVLFDVAFTLVRRRLSGERITQAHRGHLYQVAARAGVPAWAVTLLHAGFAVLGGLFALAFIAASGTAKPWIPLLTLLPQIIWLAYVTRRARQAGLGQW
jgi:UDP-GlcNAc:undecaprenyl-phosphate GlcNAc-1-phosphate transferase